MKIDKSGIREPDTIDYILLFVGIAFITYMFRSSGILVGIGSFLAFGFVFQIYSAIRFWYGIIKGDKPVIKE